MRQLLFSFSFIFCTVCLSEPMTNDKGYSASHKNPALLEPHHKIVCIICRTLAAGVLPLCRDLVSIFFSLSRLGLHFWNVTI